MSTYGKIGWGDNSDEEDEEFFKVDNAKSLCVNTNQNFKNSLYKREISGHLSSQTPTKSVHANDYICNNKNNHIDKIRETYFHLDKLGRNYIICSPKKHINIFAELTDKEKINFLEDIEEFCNKRNIITYSVIWNSYEKYHFNVKIKCQKANIDFIKKSASAKT